MPINQISTSNTFGQWIVATQGLIDKYNYVETSANLIISTANNVTNTYNNTVSVYNSTLSTYANTYNVYNTIVDYVQTAYDNANSANQLSSDALVYASDAYDLANAALDSIVIDSIYDHANSAYVTANAAFEKANVGSAAVFKTISVSGQSDIVADSNTDTLTIVAGTGVTITTNATTDTLTIAASGTGNTSAVPDTLALRDSNGDIYANNFISSSDIRLKEDIRTIENSLELINNLRGVHFKWKNTGAEQIGLIAQEVEQVLPQVVFGEDPKSVNYAVIVSVLINAVNELTKRIEDLENNG
jgi:hypothetical protein